GGQACEPVLTGANNFRPQIRQDEIDSRGNRIGVGVKTQKFVGSTVGAGRVCAHAKSKGNGFKVFLLFVNRLLRAPPPRLVNEGAVRGVHQADDAVVDGAGQIGSEIGEFVVRAEFRNCRGRNWSGRRLRGSGASWAGIGNEDPDKI